MEDEELSAKLDKIIESINRLEGLIINLLEEKNKPEEQVLWLTQKDVAKGLNIPYSKAQKLISMPNFPKSETGRKGKYNTGPWSKQKILDFYRISKNKVR